MIASSTVFFRLSSTVSAEVPTVTLVTKDGAVHDTRRAPRILPYTLHLTTPSAGRSDAMKLQATDREPVASRSIRGTNHGRAADPASGAIWVRPDAAGAWHGAADVQHAVVMML